LWDSLLDALQSNLTVIDQQIVGRVFSPGAGIDVTHTLDITILWVVRMTAGNGSKPFFFGEFHRIEHEFFSIEPIKKLKPTGKLGYIYRFQARFYQDKLYQLEWSEKLLNPCLGFIEFVAVGDQESVGNRVDAFKMDSSPISKERAVVMVSTDPNNISTKRLLPY